MNEWEKAEYGKIPAKWSFVSASEYCDKVTDGTHDSPKSKNSGHYLITSKHIKKRKIDFVLIELSRNYLYVTDIPEEDAPSIILLLDTFGFKFNQNLNGWAIGANETPNIIDDVLLSSSRTSLSGKRTCNVDPSNSKRCPLLA